MVDSVGRFSVWKPLSVLLFVLVFLGSRAPKGSDENHGVSGDIMAPVLLENALMCLKSSEIHNLSKNHKFVLIQTLG